MEIEEALKELENVKHVRFSRLVHIAQHFFGEPRVKGSHHIFRTPWRGKPLLNIQGKRGKAKPYQVKQVKQALKRLQEIREEGVA